jgi:hypothetical protein
MTSLADMSSLALGQSSLKKVGLSLGVVLLTGVQILSRLPELRVSNKFELFELGLQITEK